MSRCLICSHEHSAAMQDALSCGVCKTCGMTLCGRRLMVRIAGKSYAFCCASCRDAYRRISSEMRKKLRHGEITEKEFCDFEMSVAI
jgi:hypothetical protein